MKVMRVAAKCPHTFPITSSDTKKYAELEHQMMEGFRQYEERLQKMRGLLEESDKNSKNTIQELKSKQLDRETLTNLLSSVINER